MALTCRTSASAITEVDPSFRLRFRVLEVRIWRAPACPLIIFPPAVSLNRLAAPLCVFNFSFGKAILPKFHAPAQVSAAPAAAAQRAVRAHAPPACPTWPSASLEKIWPKDSAPPAAGRFPTARFL